MKNYVIVILYSLLFAACATLPSPEERLQTARSLLQAAGWKETPAKLQGIALYSAAKITNPVQFTRVYIEGDGFAFLDGNQISPDPTPRTPMLLALATQDNAANVAYIARPCQYLLSASPACSFHDWSDKRFSAQNLARMSQALDSLKTQLGISQFELVGYSGGGAFALALAASRDDVVGVRTIAGNVALAEFIDSHGLRSFDTAIDPMRALERLRTIPQQHLVSNDDHIIPPTLTQHYLHALQSPCANVVIVDNPTHGSGWEESWNNARNQPLKPCP